MHFKKHFFFFTSSVLLWASPVCADEPPSLIIELCDVLRYALENQWDIHIAQEEVRRQSGLAQRDSGPFDPIFDTSLGYTWQHQVQVTGFKTDKKGKITNQKVSLKKLTRLGTTLSLSGEVMREYNPALAYSNPFIRENTFNLSFVVDQPLLRRFHDNVAAITEKVSFLELQAIKWESINVIADQLRNAVKSYWDLVAAKEILQIRTDSLARLQQLSVSTKRLVEGGQIAASELNQQYAELAAVDRQRTNAEQQVYAAFNNLLDNIGMEQCDFSLFSPHLTLESFPHSLNEKPVLSVNRLVDEATCRRLDLLAAQIRVQTAALQVRSAQNATLPEMNVRMGTNVINSEVGGRAKPFYSATRAPRPETDFFAALDFSTPIGNNGAIGEFRERRAEKLQACLAEAKLRSKDPYRCGHRPSKSLCLAGTNAPR